MRALVDAMTYLSKDVGKIVVVDLRDGATELEKFRLQRFVGIGARNYGDFDGLVGLAVAGNLSRIASAESRGSGE